MTAVINTIRVLLRIIIAVLLVLGFIIWFGGRENLMGIHVAFGFAFVLLLWLLAGVGARARVGAGLVAATAVWGLLLPIVGFAQLHLLPGSAHWIIQIIHLLIGIAAMPLAERVAGRALRASAPSVAARA